jgi:cell division protein FtsB
MFGFCNFSEIHEKKKKKKKKKKKRNKKKMKFLNIFLK